MSIALELKRGERPAEIVRLLEQLKDAASRRRIRCPTCGWEPSRSSRWSCVPTGPPEYYEKGCFTAWNTFDTQGRCPGCDHAWQWTVCLSCGMWALHENWYDSDEDDGDGP